MLHLKRKMFFAAASLLATMASHSGVRELMEKIVNDEITFELKVLDPHGQPVDGATVWFFGDSVIRTDLRIEDMQRLVTRHGADVDFIFEKSLHPALLIERTQINGLATVRLEDADIGELSTVRTHFAVLKRGWSSEVVTRKVQKGARDKITVRLKPDPLVRADPRLERLDHLRAAAYAVINSPGEVLTEANERTLRDIGTELRGLATELETEGAADAAATVYYNLAYLPTVTIDEDAGKGTRTREYTTGFHADSRQKMADREAAWRLVKTHPAVSYQAVFEKYKTEGLLRGPSDLRDAVRRAYLTDTERFFTRFRNEAWPTFHVTFWQMYGATGQPDLACAALKDFFDFEPSYYTPAQWRKQLENYEADVRLFRSLPSGKCELPGLAQVGR